MNYEYERPSKSIAAEPVIDRNIFEEIYASETKPLKAPETKPGKEPLQYQPRAFEVFSGLASFTKTFKGQEYQAIVEDVQNLMYGEPTNIKWQDAARKIDALCENVSGPFVRKIPELKEIVRAAGADELCKPELDLLDGFASLRSTTHAHVAASYLFNGDKVSAAKALIESELAPVPQLNLSEFPIKDKDFEQFGALKGVKQVRFNGSASSGEFAKTIAKFGELWSLSLSNLRSCTDEQLAHLQKLEKLQEIEIRKSSIPINKFAAQLAKLPSLHAVRIHDVAGVNDETARLISGTQKLNLIDLAGGTLTDQGLLELSKNLNLVALRLVGDNKISRSAVEALVRKCPIKLLSISDMDDSCVVPLAKSDLQILVLDSDKLTDRAIQNLVAIPKLSTLSLLHTNLTDTGIADLIGRTQLQCLRLETCGPKTLEALKTCKQLTQLVLPEGSVDPGQCKDLKQSLPNCSIAFAASLRR